MKIRTQITLGYFSLVTLIVVLAVYSFLQTRWLNRINQSLTSVDFQARRLEIEQFGLLEDIFNYDLKYLATRDIDYLHSILELQRKYEQGFEDLNRLLVSPAEQEQAKKIRDTYSEYKKVFAHRTTDSEKLPAEAQIEQDNRKYELTQSLRHLYVNLENATHEVMQRHSKESGAVRRRVQRIAMGAGLLAVGLAVALSLFLARRISSPLIKLMEGTRKIAAGQFGPVIHFRRHDEFGELAYAFNSMARQLGELEELKRGFVSNVSHELKSPLASIKETNDLLLSEVLGTLNDQQKRLLEISSEKLKVLSRRISDLLDLSRIEAGVMEYRFEPAEFSSVVQSAVETASPLLHEKNQTIVCDNSVDNLRANLDSRRIVQVLENLLTNAIKFADENSVIRVHCRRAIAQQLVSVFENWIGTTGYADSYDPATEFAVISVEDQGIGIPPGETKKIFQKFYQAHQGTQAAKGGTGLGLAICKNIVEAHQGVIWVESELGRGSSFHFAVPTSLPEGIQKSNQVV